MDSRVTPLTGRPDRRPPPRPSGPQWFGVLLVAGGIAFGYLLAQGTTTGELPVDPEAVAAIESATEGAASAGSSSQSSNEAVSFPGTILASVKFGRGLVTWPGDGEPVDVRMASKVSAAAYDASRSRIAVTLPEYGGDGYALHVGTLADLRFVESGVTGFAWHPTDPNAIAWVEESEGGFALVEALVSGVGVTARQLAVVEDRVRPVAWGQWGYALQGDNGLMTTARSGATIASADVQFLAAGSDGRLVVARPAGTPLSSDWAITGPDLADQQALNRFGDLEEHPTAAAILPLSGRIVLVSNRFGDGADLAQIEILAPDGARETVIRSGMIADSIAWSPDEKSLSVGGYYYGTNEVRSVVLLAASDGTGEPIEIPFDHQVRPLGIRN